MKKIFRLEGLGCANCAAKMERDISKLDGVRSATVNFITTKLVIDADDAKIDGIVEKSRRIIKKLEPYCVMK